MSSSKVKSYQLSNGDLVTVSGSTETITNDGVNKGAKSLDFDETDVEVTKTGISEDTDGGIKTINVADNRSDVIVAEDGVTITDQRTGLVGGGTGNTFVGGDGVNRLTDAGTAAVGSYSDVLVGGSSNDLLAAGNGNDVLVGGDSGDTMIVGKGADRLVFLTSGEGDDRSNNSPYAAGGPVATAAASASPGHHGDDDDGFGGWDVIKGFRSGVDKLVFDQATTVPKGGHADDATVTVGGVTLEGAGLDASLTGKGPAELTWIGSQGTDAQAGQANAVRAHAVWQDANGFFVYANLDGSGEANIKIQVATQDSSGNWHGVFLNSTDFTGVASSLSVNVALSGTAEEGQTLTATTTVSGGSAGTTVHYTWQSSSDGGATWTTIAGAADQATYAVQEGDEHHLIHVVATAVDSQNGTGSGTSGSTSSVLDAAPTVTTPTIAGTAQEGQTLTASAGSGQSDNPVTYQWMSGSTVLGAGSTYVVKEGDEGNQITVVATATNDDGVKVSATSAATSAVIDAAPTITAPTITGAAQEGQTLTASASAGQGDNPVTFQWMSGSTVLGTGTTYLVKESDEGSHITVVATATNEQGATASATSAATSTVLDAAPTVTTPTIGGSAQEGQTLTASASSGSGDPVTYQWVSGNTVVGTGSTYLVQESDEAHHITVVATATNGDGATTSATSAATSAVTDAAPTVTTPTITGTAQEGQTLTVSASAGQGDNAVTFHWMSGNTVLGAGATYVVKESDEGHQITVVATATNDNGVTASATSAATTAVTDAAPTVTTPTIAGTAQEGQTLTASASAGQSDDPVSFQWMSGNTVLGTGSTYAVQEGDEGHHITVVATATNEQGATASATSAATSAVTDAAPTVTTPTISGTAQEGQTLTASAGSGQSDNPVTYQWMSGNTVLGTGSTYAVREGDEGHHITVVATATNEQGATASATSAATSAVTDAAPTVTTPTIAGTAQEGQTLTASASAGQSDNPVSYQWYSGGNAIANATGQTYTVQEGDEGNAITVAATAHNEQGATASATSAATSAVTDAAPTVTAPVIAGTAQEGQTLTASVTTGQSDNPATFQWMSGNTVVGTGATYLVQESDESHQITVVATVTNEQGLTASATSAASPAVIDAAPFVGVPVIIGTIQQGQTLTASDTSAQSDNPITYQWFSDTTLVGTGSTYLVQESDEGREIVLLATATNEQGLPSFGEARSGVVVDAAPTVASLTVTGTAQEGHSLTANAVAGDSDSPVAYQWQSSSDGGQTWSDISGATAAAYAPVEADEGNLLHVVVTVTNDAGASASTTSAASSAVVDAAPAFIPYSFTTFTAPGAVNVIPTSINVAGQVAGFYADGASTDHGFIYDHGTIATFDPVGATQTSVFAMNDLGVAAGNYTDILGNSHGFTYDHGTIATFDAAVGAQTFVNAINASGQLAGYYADALNQQTSFIDDHGIFTTFSVAGAFQTDALSINATGVVTGLYSTDGSFNNTHSFIYDHGSLTTFDVPGAAQTSAVSINDAGVVAGFYNDALGNTHGFTDNHGAFTTLDAPGDVFGTFPQSINASGEVTGIFSSLANISHGFVDDALNLTPFDVPGALSTSPMSINASGQITGLFNPLDLSSSQAFIATPGPPVTLTGTAEEGQTLTVFAAPASSDDTISFQWQSSSDGGTTWTQIAGATASTYAAVEGDEGHLLRATATVTNDNGVSLSAASAATATVLDAPAHNYTFGSVASSTPANAQTIMGFQAGVDTIDLSAIAGASSAITSASATALQAGQVEIVNGANNTADIFVNASAATEVPGAEDMLIHLTGVTDQPVSATDIKLHA